jgi:hypothetical protein
MRTLIRRALPLAFAPLSLVLPAVAQGSDSCATPTVITGQGSFPFNTTAATTGTEGQYACSGSTGIQRDVWFSWVAPADGSATLSLCGGASFDSKISSYAGSGCPSAGPLACNDDYCGLQSVIAFPVTMGNNYTLQIGSWPTAPGGAGTFSLTVGPPPPPCGTSTGPDVIVGDINGVMNASAVGGIDAIALGTTSCNVGTAVVNWIGSTNDHPVIRQNLYRYKVVGGAGRFEQVGFSWVKHGFGAAQDSYCCTCQGNGDGQHLGVGCSDPYDAGTNGSQPGAGPNWQVNAHTGVFTYPPANPSHGSDSIYRRCQVALTDLEVTGGGNTTRFFGEGHYVTKDDATAGNQNNNASWREMTVSGGSSNYNLALSGTTQETHPAIRAWAVVDPAANLVDLQIPGDGLLVLGTRATDLGGGQWRYEYAVYNMNADRDVGSFSVPIAAGVSVMNIGFHDVSYHDGDGPGNANFAGTDWTASQGGSALTWACETEAQNPSANSLRWGTLYNFRFDANAQPQTGPITLGLWRPGAPASVVGNGDVPGGGPVTSFCLGDGSGAPCPCGNSGAAGHGCENSVSTGGALLTSSGNPSLSADTLVLTSSGERPTSFSLFVQGDSLIPALNFGDGIRCVGGNLKRLYTRNAAGGAVTAPQGGDPSISARSSALGDTIPVQGTRVYQIYYRDPNPSFCPDPPGSTFNVSNGLMVLWGP